MIKVRWRFKGRRLYDFILPFGDWQVGMTSPVALTKAVCIIFWLCVCVRNLNSNDDEYATGFKRRLNDRHARRVINLYWHTLWLCDCVCQYTSADITHLNFVYQMITAINWRLITILFYFSFQRFICCVIWIKYGWHWRLMAARRGCMSHYVVRSFSFILKKKEVGREEVGERQRNQRPFFFTDELTEPVHT